MIYNIVSRNSHFTDTVYMVMPCRVQEMISVRAGLKKVPWDGYLKYFRPSPKLIERKYDICQPFYFSCKIQNAFYFCVNAYSILHFLVLGLCVHIIRCKFYCIIFCYIIEANINLSYYNQG